MWNGEDDNVTYNQFFPNVRAQNGFADASADVIISDNNCLLKFDGPDYSFIYRNIGTNNRFRPTSHGTSCTPTIKDRMYYIGGETEDLVE